ncbi:MAG: DMT family transporter [Pikeienuella sp.]
MAVNVLILFFCGAVWGLSFTLMRVVMLGGAHPLAAAFWHAVVANLLIWTALAVTGRLPRVNAGFLRFSAITGFLGAAGPTTLLFWAAEHIGAGVLSVCMATAPLMQIGLSAALGIERFHIHRLVGLLFGLAAVWIIADPANDAAPTLWVALAALGGFLYACEDSFLAAKRPASLSSLQILAGLMLFYAIYTAPALIFVDPTLFSLSAPGETALAFLVMVPSSLCAYGAFVHLIARAGPVFASQVSYVVTISGVICSMAILGESHEAGFWVALGLVVIGLALGLPGTWRPKGA